MLEFRYGKVARFFLSLLCLGLIALFIWGLFQFSEKNPKLYYFLILPGCIAMIGVAMLGIIDVFVGKFVIAENSVTTTSPFGSRTLLFDDIRGFRVDDKYIRIYPTDPRKKQLKVSPYLKDAKEIIYWLEVRYPNLEELEALQEERQVLNDESLGITEEQRADRLNQARKVAKFLNGGAWLLLIWMLFFKKYHIEYALVICCVYPLLAVFATLQYRGIITVDDREGSKLPTVGIAMLVPGFVLALRALMNFNIMTYPVFIWGVMAMVSVVITIMYMLPSFKSDSKPLRFYGTGALMIFLNLFYAYGVVTTANCMLDQSPPVEYTTTIASKSVSNGKMTTYHIKLKPWAAHIDEEEQANLSRADFESVEEGDSVIVQEHAGWLKMKWFEIEL